MRWNAGRTRSVGEFALLVFRCQFSVRITSTLAGKEEESGREAGKGWIVSICPVVLPKKGGGGESKKLLCLWECVHVRMSMSVRGVRVGPVVLLLSVPLVCADSYVCV